MGSWGVKAHESDYGLDILASVEKALLKPIEFRHFDVSRTLAFLRNYIIEEIRYASRGCSEADMKEYIDFNLPRRYSDAVVLVAECLVEHLQSGSYRIFDYEANIEIEITEFIFTRNDLDALIEGLHGVLEPEHELYECWADSESFDEWQAHIESLCKCLKRKRDNL